MLSSEGELTDHEEIEPQVLTATARQGEQERDRLTESLYERKQIFELIDNLLSFEACLYHQILPLGLEDNQLLLGMVHQQDREALDYVNRILSYIHCSMVIEAIPADIHRTILSAYLNYKNTSHSDAKNEYQPRLNFTSKKNVASLTDKANYSELDQQTTWIDSQAELLQPARLQVDYSFIPTANNVSPTSTAFPPIQESEEENNCEPVTPENLTILPVPISDTFSSIEGLVTLSPKKLLEELLGRVVAGGIGRLYLERQSDQGRILWSDNGVLQSVIEDLSLSLFQGVINELKQFAGLPVDTVTEPKQVETEWPDQQNSLLLRLRVMPGIYGEEATLQVLRGAALKFYQQQQLDRLSRDTLGITQQLSLKLHELQKRLLLNPSLKSEQLEAVVALNQLVENLNKQINILAGDSQPPNKSK
ncbi:MAG: pilus assembly protein PilB [Mojavia pulchra JT2-VF2]|jgi:type II secretory ATPase GspE/PulE/Tfp pilus assembly ATPase PilB-like protein|uniref:Pilus assembly protein PilB n=1 Tax=Mojavia pulchra JT2-VF2 TaxID=287848 RepID=A0A951Q0V1_9NOST|nr:pilus assembly protein PilB [Mojavia pulchra JT2-VF2]